MKEPIQKPINIPGRRKVLTKNRILESQKHTKSNMEAARWLEVNYNTYKKWAKYYGVFEQHLNQKGVGIKKGFGKYYGTITKTGGAILLATGILITTNYIQVISYYILTNFPILAKLG